MRKILSVIAVLLLISACGGTDEKAAEKAGEVSERAGTFLDSFAFGGQVRVEEGMKVTDKTRLVVAWIVQTENPGYAYIWGNGRITPQAFEVDLPGTPPQAAMNTFKVAVGVLVATENKDIKAGNKYSRADFKPVVGGADRYAIVYKDPDYKKLNIERFDNLPEGFSTAIGQPAADGAYLEKFKPVKRTEVTVRITEEENLDWVEWN